MSVGRTATTVGLGIVATSAVYVLWFLFPQILQSWEWGAYDARLQWRGNTEISPYLVIIGRDAESDARFGIGLWDRAKFAKVMTALAQADAAVIAVDFHFAGASPADRGGLASDQALAEATAKAGNVVYPLMVAPAVRDILHVPYAPNDWIAEVLARTAPRLDSDAHRLVPAVASVSGPLQSIGRSLRGLGHIASLSDEDGAYRRVSVYVKSEGHLIPSLGMAVATAFLHLAPNQIVFEPGQALVLHDAALPDGSRHSITVPVDAQGNLLINYAGRWADGPFPYLSFVDVWDAIEEGRLEELRAQVAGKIVLLMHAGLEADKRRTPVEVKAPGGFIHANAINTILTGRALREVSFPVQLVIVATLAVGSAAVVLAVPTSFGLGLVIAVMGVYVGTAQAVLATSETMVPIVLPLVAIVLAAGGALAWAGRLARTRIRSLEEDIHDAQHDLATNQEWLARHESAVERLEEELWAAQAASSESAGQKRQWAQQEEGLKAKLASALAQVEKTRLDVRMLEGRLHSLSAAAVAPTNLSDAAQEALRQECVQLGILTQDPAVLKMFRDVKKAAPSRSPILLLGETGTGKELFARAVHLLSGRSHAPFVAVNVAAISPDVVESELFGHVRGAFTGADRGRKGYFEQAEQGTIFLDEIGDLRAEVQAKLLRVLQEGVFHRVGATGPTRVDVRVVAATNKDLAHGVAQRWFREDLYFRLRGIELRLPPLRERKGDLSLLVQQFIQDAVAEGGRGARALSRSALEAIERWPWTGNVRELKQRIEQAVILAEGDLMTEQDLRLERSVEADSDGKGADSSPVLDVTGDSAVLACLQKHAFDMQATAQDLGCDRSTVTQRLKGMCFYALMKHDGDRREAAVLLAGERALVRIVAVKLEDYYGHLLETVQSYASVEEAVAACRKRFKNIPERYLPAMETLVRQHYIDKTAAASGVQR